MEAYLPQTRIIRVMPNTPARFGKGISAYAPGRKASPADEAVVTGILEAVGKAVRVDENQMDAVTAVSGSGPAYLFYFAEAMIDAAVYLGLSRSNATLLVNETIAGAAEMLKSGEHPAKLRNDVTSPAGTTAAALFEFEKGAVTGVVMNALIAAAQRSAELGKAAETKHE
jgi:pyrroline-5-carboxylate reductase